MQVAGWGIGMARSLYANAVKAIGPDAMVIADPVIPDPNHRPQPD